MTTIENILGQYLTKIADFNSYSQILALQKAISALQAALKSKDADPNVSKNISAAIKNVNVLASMAGKYGITAPLSARYRNEINSNIEKIESALSNINPYTDFAKNLNQVIPGIKSALDSYIPTNIAAQEQSDTSVHPGKITPVERVKTNPLDVATNEENKDKWTLNNDQPTKADPIDAVNSAPSGQAATTQPKIPFNTSPVKPVERVNPNIFHKGPEEVPAPGEPIGAKSSSERIEQLKKFAAKVFF
jgi:hypothetical protein